MDRSFLLHDPTLWVGRGGLAVFLVHVQAFHESCSAIAVHIQYTAFSGAIHSCQHLDHVPFLDVRLLLHWSWVQSTSGAREMIFMNFFSRNSLATGPKMRVPFISPAASSNTTALSSKRM